MLNLKIIIGSTRPGRAIDSVFASFAFRHKPAAFVGYSGGIAAGIRAIEHLAHIVIEAEMGDLQVSHDTRLVVLQFPSLGQAHAWWDSADYRPLVKLRQPPVSDSRAFLVEGIGAVR